MKKTEDRLNAKSWGGFKESFNRVRVLTAMQLKNNKKKKILTTGRKALSIILSILLFALVTGIMYGLMFILSLTSLSFVATYHFLIMFLMVMQITSIISCTVGMMNSLFLSSDNMILLSFPCRHSEVFLSKLAVFYVSEFKKNLFVILPFMIALGFFQKQTVHVDYLVNYNFLLYYSFALLSTIFLPLVPVLFGSVFALPCAYLKRFIKSNPIIEAVILVIGVAILYVIVSLIIKRLPSNIPIFGQLGTIISKIALLIRKISNYGLYCKLQVDLMFNIKPLMDILIIVAIIVIGLIATTFIVMPFFFKLASHSMEEAVLGDHKKKGIQSKNIFMTFLLKDLRISSRNLGSSLGNFLMLFVIPPVIVLLTSVYSRVKLNTSLAPFLVHTFVLMFILLMSYANNSLAATAITREGSEFVLVKTAPNKTSTIAWSKFVIQVVAYTVCLSLSFIILWVWLKIENSKYMLDSPSLIGPIKIPELLSIYLVALFGNIGLILQAIQLDIRNPHLTEFAATGSNSENKNVSQTNTYGVVTALIFTVIYLVMNIANFTNNFLVVIIASVFYFVLRFILFKKIIYAFFDDIEL